VRLFSLGKAGLGGCQDFKPQPLRLQVSIAAWTRYGVNFKKTSVLSTLDIGAGYAAYWVVKRVI